MISVVAASASEGLRTTAGWTRFRITAMTPVLGGTHGLQQQITRA
jgi:hypothetical protein